MDKSCEFVNGKIQGEDYSIYPDSKVVILEENKYVKNYSLKEEFTTFKVAEIDDINNIKFVNNGNITYYNTLSEAITAAPTNGSLSQIQILADTQMYSNITIDSGKNILLDFSKYDGQAVGLPFNIPFVKMILNK